MPKLTKICRVCGGTYEACRSIKTGSGVFNWREMCCSPECGQTYLQRVEESRTQASKANEKKVHTRRGMAVRTAPVPDEVAQENEREEQPIGPTE